MRNFEKIKLLEFRYLYFSKNREFSDLISDFFEKLGNVDGYLSVMSFD